MRQGPGCLLAALCVQTAEEGYKQLLQAHPAYTDCMLRLACIARATGNHAEAIQHAKVH